MSLFPRTKRPIRPTRRRDAGEPSIARHVFIGVGIIVLVIAICALTWYLTRRIPVSLQTVTVEGGETISHDDVTALVNQELSGNYFLLVPHRFTYLYPHDRIVAVLNTIPRIHNVVVTRTSRQSLDVTFEEYVPTALWCLSTEEGAPCYFLDASGYAFAPAPDLIGGALTRYVLEGKDMLAQGQALSSDLLTNLNHFLKTLEEKLSLRVYLVVYTKDEDLELWLSGGGKIYVTSTMDAQQTFNNLQSVLTSKQFAHLKPGNFNYIDLRFGDKIYVNEQKATTTPMSSSTLSQ